MEIDEKVLKRWIKEELDCPTKGSEKRIKHLKKGITKLRKQEKYWNHLYGKRVQIGTAHQKLKEMLVDHNHEDIDGWGDLYQ